MREGTIAGVWRGLESVFPARAAFGLTPRHKGRRKPRSGSELAARRNWRMRRIKANQTKSRFETRTEYWSAGEWSGGTLRVRGARLDQIKPRRVGADWTRLDQIKEKRGRKKISR